MVTQGFHILEVPLNSPEPFQSISLLRQNLPQHIIVGAGTVLKESDIEELRNIQADIVVMLHCSSKLIAKSISCELVPFSGFSLPQNPLWRLNQEPSISKYSQQTATHTYQKHSNPYFLPM